MLGFAHRLVVDLLKAELVDVEVRGLVLVADTYTNGADFREHTYLLFIDRSISMIADIEQNLKYD